MALHKVVESGDAHISDIYSTGLSLLALPKYSLPRHSIAPFAAYSLVRDELMLDGNSRQNLATFCSTWIEPEASQLMMEAIEKNLIDKDEYPQTAELEKRCVHIIANLWHVPSSWKAIGCSTAGSSEAAMLGGLAMKRCWKHKRALLGLAADKPNLVCGSVQICWKRFALFFDVELREIPLRGDALGLLPDGLREVCDENTIGVVATLGVTFTGVYEPVAAIAGTLDLIEQECGFDIPMHVDAASGGFVAPFIHQEIQWDFMVDRVKSINASGHKFGLAPLGVGWIIWRSTQYLPEELISHINYLGGTLANFSVNFSRPAGQVVAQYYNFLRLGWEGYTRIQQNCAAIAQWLAAELAKIYPLEVLFSGAGGLPLVCYKLKNVDSLGFTLYDLAERVRMHGWQIATYPLPAAREKVVVQRILVRHGSSRELMGLLLRDLRGAISHLQNNPVSNSTAGATFQHDSSSAHVRTPHQLD